MADELAADPIDQLCERIEAQLRISVPLDARAQLIGAATAVKFWAWADTRVRKPGETRIRTQRFFTFILIAFEISTGRRAGVSQDRINDTVGGDFFEMAKICSTILPKRLRPRNDVALADCLVRASRRRTFDPRN